jgi:soluble P-type ATPase
VAAFGNGRNDRLMLKAAALGVAVMGREGCAVDALQAADLCVGKIEDGLDLLLHPKRLEATLKL